jgi:hypothetical protein
MSRCATFVAGRGWISMRFAARGRVATARAAAMLVRHNAAQTAGNLVSG